MSPAAVEALIAAAGVALSIGGSVFTAGRRSQMLADHERRLLLLEQLPQKIGNIESSMSNMSHDLAEIKGMFKLTLKEST